jgi:hypothetical protein
MVRRMSDDKYSEKYSDLARSLADTLMRWARDRRPDDQKGIAQLQTELCALRRHELTPPSPDQSGADSG